MSGGARLPTEVHRERIVMCDAADRLVAIYVRVPAGYFVPIETLAQRPA